MNDFSRLDNIVKEMGSEWLFFDEIQMIDKWELYVRQKHDEGSKVVFSVLVFLSGNKYFLKQLLLEGYSLLKSTRCRKSGKIVF